MLEGRAGERCRITVSQISAETKVSIVGGADESWLELLVEWSKLTKA